MSVPPYEVAETIRRKKAQDCRFADTRQLEHFDGIALPDATFKFVDREGAVVNMAGVDCDFPDLAAFRAHLSKTLAAVDAIHMINPGELELVVEDEVRAVFAVLYHSGAPGTEDGLHATGAGHYHEVWKKVGGDWFLKSLWMQRLYWKVQVI